METGKMFLRILWIYTVTILYCNCQTTTLTPVNPDVIEGSDINFVCTVSSEVRYVSWKLLLNATSFLTSALAVQNGTCALSPSTSYLSDTTKYSYTCTSTVYQMTVKNVQRSQLNNVWSCYPSGQTSGPTSTINVQVPVSSVSLTPSSTPVDVRENTTKEFICQTSASRPDASVTWYKIESGVTSQINQNITSSTNNVDFSVTTSSLRFVPSRQQDGVQIFCKAANTVNTRPIQSAKNTLNVLYKAEDPVVSEGNEYRVLEGKTGKLSCYIERGSPLATIVWECNNLSPDETVSSNNGSLTKTLTWTAVRGSNISCSCISQLPGFPNIIALVNVTVLYEANIKSFSVDGFTQKLVVVNEKDKVHLACIAEGIPTPTISLRKTGDIFEPVMSNRVDVILKKASCLNSGLYSCSAINEYNAGMISIEHVYLFVRCTPRARDSVVTERTADIDHTVTFVFNALAYPYLTFTWLKLVKAEWKQLSNGGNIKIQSSDLLSNLTIRKINPTDFTYYKVIIKNGIGIDEQMYELLQSKNQNSDRTDQNGESTDIAPVIGYTIGATVGCVILIILTVLLVWIFRFRKAETNRSKEPAMTQVQETAVETAFQNIMNDAQQSSEPSSEGGMYYNQESSSNYETLDTENQVVSSYSGLETTTSGQTNIEGTYVKMD